MDSDEERNYYCLLLLLLRVGTPKLRAYFIRKWDSAGHRPWMDCPQDGADLTRIWKPKILPYENTKVTSGDTKTWDLLLFVNILLPNEPGKAVKRALDKLKDLRNSLCHSYDAKLTKHDFQSKWNDACNALVFFGAKSGEFKSVKRDANRPLQELKPVVVKWLAHEFELVHNGQLQLLQKLDKLEKGQFTLLDAIEQTTKATVERICEFEKIQQATAEGTNPVDSDNRYRSTLEQPSKSGVTNQSAACEAEELKKYLKRYYRTGERALLLPLPWMEGDQFHIENIYTSTKLVKMNTNQESSLENMFFKEATDHRNARRILIEGETGIGKSALCKKIAYDWSMNKNPQLFPTFEVVLSLRCRDFHTGSNLWDAIEKQNFSDCLKEKKNEIFEYIESNQSDVLLILDGYDEIPDKSADTMKQSIERLMDGQLLPHCYVIVTSRPGKSSEIRNHFDRKLEIKGFELNDSFTFIRRFFVSAPINASPFISFIERFEDVKDLVRSPLNTAILCLQKKDNEELSIRSLNEEIIFSILKRYCVEKLGQKVNDDDIPGVREKLYTLGKMAVILKKDDRGNEFEENEFRNIVNPAGWPCVAFFVAILSAIWSWIRKKFRNESLREKVSATDLIGEFLVHKKTVGTIKTVSCYTFLHASLKERLATDYVKQSFRKIDFSECTFILAFKNWATFLRVICLIRDVLKSCIEDKTLSSRDIVQYVLAFLLMVIYIGFIIFTYRGWINSRSELKITYQRVN
ncbi:uncharacterized protein LOC116305803 [Actinia tenebrosa]|uniref:Uncharacterized protein LOC116305803 n=1 Tax=Actinia tenebrosa TaxID=6105 RepID=A0A6P8IW96_ACTTE|nr:uncharacterized protein LOC116305803 [Actinia tenebrosa]